MGDNKRVVVAIALFGVVVFAATFAIRSWQIDRFTENLRNAVSDIEVQEEPFDITLLKVGYAGATYTLPEFIMLDDIPTVVDILIMQDNGVMETKPAYVSYATSPEEKDIRYVDGVYGRLILPMEYSRR